jgi:hypothetical protein
MPGQPTAQSTTTTNAGASATPTPTANNTINAQPSSATPPLSQETAQPRAATPMLAARADRN